MAQQLTLDNPDGFDTTNLAEINNRDLVTRSVAAKASLKQICNDFYGEKRNYSASNAVFIVKAINFAEQILAELQSRLEEMPYNAVKSDDSRKSSPGRMKFATSRLEEALETSLVPAAAMLINNAKAIFTEQNQATEIDQEALQIAATCLDEADRICTQYPELMGNFDQHRYTKFKPEQMPDMLDQKRAHVRSLVEELQLKANQPAPQEPDGKGSAQQLTLMPTGHKSAGNAVGA